MISQYIERYEQEKCDWYDTGEVLIDAGQILTPKQYENLLAKIGMNTELANGYIYLAEYRKEYGTLAEQTKLTLEQKKAEERAAKKEAKRLEKVAEEERALAERMAERAARGKHRSISMDGALTC